MNLTVILSVLTDLVLLMNIWFLYRKVKAVRDENKNVIRKAKALMTTNDMAFTNLSNRISDLENGVIPDYEAAKQAKEAVNDFSKGITNLLGFDPYEALHKNDIKDET